MKKYKKYIILLCAVLTLLLAACSADGQKRQITPEELDPTLNQEIDPDKEILIYARTSPNDGAWFNRQAVDEFNRSHDDIQILVKDYYGSEEDKAQGYERLRSEMAAGQVPDIIDLAGVSYSQAIQKGYLEDLWPYIENDPDLGRDGVLEAPLKAAEVNGGLYAAFGAVTVDTLLGTASQVGDRTSWTFQEIQDAFEAMPEGATLLQFDASREMIAGILMHLSLENYVDQETGTCSFDSPGFRSMLEFASRFPTQKEVEAETAAFADDFAKWKEAEERFVSGLQMLDNSQYVALTSLPKLNARHGGRCAFIGYPVEDGSTGSIFRLTGQCIAMSSTCENKEAAYEVLDFLLADENIQQYIDDQNAVPCKNGEFRLASMLDGMLEFIESGNMTDYQDHYYPSEMSVDALLQTFLIEKDVDAFLADFDRNWQRYNRDIIRMVQEYAQNNQ